MDSELRFVIVKGYVTGQARRKRHGTFSICRYPYTGFLMLSLGGGRLSVTLSSAMKNEVKHVQYFFPGKPIRGSVSKGLFGWLHRPPLPGMFEIPDSKKESMFTINHVFV